jgi:thiaminase/transcriptional activator TenA
MSHRASFCAEMWERTAKMRRAIHELPYNVELASGTLSESRFRHYIAQDSLYLRRYSRALALLAAKAPATPEGTEALRFWAQSAHEAMAVEQAMHGGFLDQFDIDAADLASAQMSPACQGYTDFLIATCYEQPYAVGVAALLPCFWIYQDVGEAIAAKSAPSNPYQAWIDTYSDPSFAAATEQAKALCDAAAAQASESDLAAMRHAFQLSTEFEFEFWSSAYEERGWPLR